MAETKHVTIFRGGGTGDVQAEIIPGETADQVCALAAPQLGLPAGGSYRLLGSDGNQITGDVYKAVKDGDKLTLAQVGEGGSATTHRCSRDATQPVASK